jgi:hypothetical protein
MSATFSFDDINRLTSDHKVKQSKLKGSLSKKRDTNLKLKKMLTRSKGSLSKKRETNSKLKIMLTRSRDSKKNGRTRRINAPRMNELKTKTGFWCPLRRSRSWIYKHGDKNGKYLSYDGLRKDEIERVQVGKSYRYKNKKARTDTIFRLKQLADSNGLSVKDYMEKIRNARSARKSKVSSKSKPVAPRRSARLQEKKLK